MNKNLENDSNYRILITNLSQSLREHARKGNSGELIIRYRPEYCLFDASLETKLNLQDAKEVIHNFHSKIVTFSQDTTYNRNGNEAAYKVMVYNQGKRMVISVCYKYKVKL
jgi:hypothetical protein